MNCRQFRKRLPATADSHELLRHLEGCEDCAKLAARLELARDLFREHRSEFAPDAGFTARVGAQMQVDSGSSLSWAALRVLPLTLALLALLTWFSWAAPHPSVEVASPTDDLLGWVIENDGDRP